MGFRGSIRLSPFWRGTFFTVVPRGLCPRQMFLVDGVMPCRSGCIHGSDPALSTAGFCVGLVCFPVARKRVFDLQGQTSFRPH